MAAEAPSSAEQGGQVMKGMKNVACLALAALLLTAACGCTGNADPSDPNADPEVIGQAMLDVDTTLPEMVTRSSGDADAKDNFSFLSDLDYGKVEAYFYAYADAGTAEEMAVIKLKDKSDAAAMMESLHDHVERRRGTFAEYDPEQVPLTEDAVVIREGRYVALIVSQKNGLAQKEFRKFFDTK